MLTRRSILAATTGLVATTLITETAMSQSSSTPSDTDQAPGFYRYRIGDITVTAINDGNAVRPIDGLIRNADIADVRQALTDAFMPTDRIALTFTALALQMGGRLVLIDTGNGDLGPPTAGMWMANAKAAGFAPEDVDTVVISHFHGDHINGLRRKDGTAVFPRAEIKVPAPEWDFWMDDAKMAAAPDAAKGNFQNVRRVFGPIAKDVGRFNWNDEVVPGITAVGAAGHTPGHTAFNIQSGNDRLFFMADTTNHPALFVRNPEWQAAFDMDGNLARDTRRKLLDMAAADRVQVAFYHAPFPATGHITKRDDGYDLVPVAWNPHP
jgi:glyoxylase-like metal-dependent hydrolase (beta-lactamase superfamily II)